MSKLMNAAMEQVENALTPEEAKQLWKQIELELAPAPTPAPHTCVFKRYEGLNKVLDICSCGKEKPVDWRTLGPKK